jgi:hypothetical protein
VTVDKKSSAFAALPILGEESNESSPQIENGQLRGCELTRYKISPSPLQFAPYLAAVPVIGASHHPTDVTSLL